MLELDKKYFWDIDFRALDPEKHKRFIIGRMLERGNWPEFKSILEYYGQEQVKNILLNLRYMDKKSLRFCSFYFRIPKEDFRCYKSMR